MAKKLKLFVFLVGMIHCVLSISWKREPNVVVLGESISLKCMVEKDECPTPTLRHWMRGNELLCKNDNCNKTRKYKMSGDNFSLYSSKLTIYNLSMVDLNLNYFYFCGFKTYNQTVSDKGVISYPSNRTTNVNTTIANGMLHVNFQLDGVNPVPNCTIEFKDKTLQEQIPFDIERRNNLQNVIYRHNMSLNYMCNGRLQIVCKVYSRRIHIINRYLDNCPAENMSLTERKRIYLIPVVATIASIIFISAAVIYFIRNYHQRPVYGGISNKTRV